MCRIVIALSNNLSATVTAFPFCTLKALQSSAHRVLRNYGGTGLKFLETVLDFTFNEARFIAIAETVKGRTFLALH